MSSWARRRRTPRQAQTAGDLTMLVLVDWFWHTAVLVLLSGLAVVVAFGVAMWWRAVATVLLDVLTLPLRWLVRIAGRRS